MTRSFIIALQFLTRVPTPVLKDFAPEELGASARWFPAIGALIGACVLAAALLGNRVDPRLGALLALVVWIAITGALHLDGLADLADALGAAHRNPKRFLEVLGDPHLGAFGAIALIVAIVAKLVLLSLALTRVPNLAFACVLVPAWARFGALVWSVRLRPLHAGSGERFAWRISPTTISVWAVLLVAASAVLSSTLLCAPLLILGWEVYLRVRVGGMTGDCLGAGIEVIEIGLLLSAVLLSAVQPT
jgi:adenosylcobinamide-GDP ribazoletransferase